MRHVSLSFCPWFSAVSIPMCIPEDNLSIFHSITAENAGWRRGAVRKGEGKGKNRRELLDCNEQVAGAEYRSRRWTAGPTSLRLLLSDPHSDHQDHSLLSFTINDKHQKISRVIHPSLRRQEATEQVVCQSEAGACVSRIAGALASVSCIGRLNKRTVIQSEDSPAASESTGRQRLRNKKKMS